MEKSINFFSEECEFALSEEKKYTEWLTQLAASHDIELQEVNYIFSTDEYVLGLNKQYLDHDYYTDILSFPMSQDPIAGDIFISIDRVKDNAKQEGVSFEKELLRVMCHGLLHFIGFDDHDTADQAEMRQQEEIAIKLFEEVV